MGIISISIHSHDHELKNCTRLLLLYFTNKVIKEITIQKIVNSKEIIKKEIFYSSTEVNVNGYKQKPKIKWF